MALSKKAVQLLREDPDDVERYHVVADQLLARGDPRGELISLELARLNAPVTKARALTREINRLVKAHAKQLLGGLWTASSTTKLTWHLGFIREASLWTSATALAPPFGRRLPKPKTNRLLKLTDELLRLESAVLLGQLSLCAPYNSQLFLWDAAERVSRGAPALLRTLDLRDLYQGEPPDWEPMLSHGLVWRGRPFRLRSDSLALQSLAELFA